MSDNIVWFQEALKHTRKFLWQNLSLTVIISSIIIKISELGRVVVIVPKSLFFCLKKAIKFWTDLLKIIDLVPNVFFIFFIKKYA